MKNLLTETIETLKNHDKTPTDVLWLGSKEAHFNWEIFRQLADESYDDGYGCAEVAENLCVVGDNWWLERHEYDGREWWEYKELPIKPLEEAVPIKLISAYAGELKFIKIT